MATSKRERRGQRNGSHRSSGDDSANDMAKGRAFWSGTISFGLVSVPVELFPATRSSTVHFRMLSPDGTPVRRRYYCPEHNQDVEADEIVRGYEVAKGEYVVLRDEELESLEPQKSRDIDLRLFVNVAEIPPTYFERAYYLAPSGNSNKAYRLLAEVMQQTGKAGIATFVMRDKEYLVAILAENHILRAETLRFHDELRTPEEVGLPAKPRLDKDRVARFERIIRKHTADELDPEEMLDEQSRRLMDIVERKYQEKQDVVRPELPEEDEDDGPSTVNLLEVIRRSLQSGGSKSGGGASSSKSPSKRRTPKSAAAGKASSGKPASSKSGNGKHSHGKHGRGKQADDQDDGPPGRSAALGSKTKDELYERAKSLDIPGRSGMSKDQLIEAIRSHK